MSVIDKAQAALDGCEVTFRTLTLAERRAYWEAEVRKAEAAHATADPRDRWQTRRAIDAAREQLAVCGPHFRVIRVADGHLMAEYTDRVAADEDAEARATLDPLFVLEPSGYRVEEA